MFYTYLSQQAFACVTSYDRNRIGLNRAPRKPSVCLSVCLSSVSSPDDLGCVGTANRVRSAYLVPVVRTGNRETGKCFGS